MKEAIVGFLNNYLNCSNSFFVTVGVMVILLTVYVICSSAGTRSLKKINNILRKESGSNIIKSIEGLRLSKRYALMWDEYYHAYSSESTVALNNYLIKDDMLLKSNVLKAASRATATLGFCFTAVGVLRLPGFWEREKINLICLALVLITVEVLFEIVYIALSEARQKRIARLLDEFRMLSLRKLPGKAVSFEGQYVFDRLVSAEERLDNVCSGISQLNARMDRQYGFLKKNMEKTEE